MDYRNQNVYCDLCFRGCRGIYHVIEQGDTLYNLGQRYHVSVSDIMRVNPYINVYNLKIGEELCIPVKGPQPRMEEDYTQQIMPDYSSNNIYTNGEYMGDMETPDIYEDNSYQRQNDMVEETQVDDMLTSPLMEGDAPDPPATEGPNFSEEDSFREVLDKLGMTMEEFLNCAAQKTD